MVTQTVDRILTTGPSVLMVTQTNSLQNSHYRAERVDGYTDKQLTEFSL